jgi:hypothetical protein
MTVSGKLALSLATTWANFVSLPKKSDEMTVGVLSFGFKSMPSSSSSSPSLVVSLPSAPLSLTPYVKIL